MIRTALCLLVIGSVAARAENRAEDNRALAEKYYRAGAKAYSAQSFEVAASNFDDAYKALAMPEIAFSAAQAYRRAFRVDAKPEYVRRAVELYHVYLDKVKSGGRVADAADGLAEMQHELDKLDKSGLGRASAPSAARTRLGVSVTVSDGNAAELGAMREIGDATGDAIKALTAKLDGNPLAPFALVDVDAKEHVLSVTADGYFPAEKKVTAVEGQSQLIELELKPMPAKVTVTTESDAQISVDGRPASSAIDLAAGKHLLAIVHRGREPFARELSVMRGEQMRVDAPLVPTGRRRAVPWIATGAAIAAGGGIACGVLALVHDGHASDLRDQIHMGNAAPSTADAYDREVQSRDHFATATWVLGGTALAAAAVATGLYLFDTPLPVVPSGAGVAVAGRF